MEVFRGAERVRLCCFRKPKIVCETLLVKNSFSSRLGLVMWLLNFTERLLVIDWRRRKIYFSASMQDVVMWPLNLEWSIGHCDALEMKVDFWEGRVWSCGSLRLRQILVIDRRKDWRGFFRRVLSSVWFVRIDLMRCSMGVQREIMIQEVYPVTSVQILRFRFTIGPPAASASDRASPEHSPVFCHTH